MRNRRRQLIAILLSIAIPLALILTVWVVLTLTQPAPTGPVLTAGDSCSVPYPPAPCLNHQPVVHGSETEPLWGAFLIGLGAGLAFAFVTTAGAAYRLGKREGYHDGITMRRNVQHAYRGKRSTYVAS